MKLKDAIGKEKDILQCEEEVKKVIRVWGTADIIDNIIALSDARKFGGNSIGIIRVLADELKRRSFANIPTSRGLKYKRTIDDDEILSHWYDDRERFVVSFDETAVRVHFDTGEVTFQLKQTGPNVVNPKKLTLCKECHSIIEVE